MGEFTAGDNLNVTQVSDQVILGRNAKTLTTAILTLKLLLQVEAEI